MGASGQRYWREHLSPDVVLARTLREYEHLAA
jgi:hypothetical protein